MKLTGKRVVITGASSGIGLLLMRIVYMVTVSALGKMALPGFALCGASKLALDGYLRSYRKEKP